MSTIGSVLNVITKDCYMAKIDIKDAYYSVPILDKHQKYLKCYFKGQLYQFMCLPNGLSSGSRKFTKLLKPPLATLSCDQAVVSASIDDLITIARNYKMCSNNVFSVVNLLDSLGFVVHPEKSQFIPSLKLEYLGVVIDSL